MSKAAVPAPRFAITRIISSSILTPWWQVEKQLRRSGGSPLKGPHEVQLVPADDSRERAFTGHLNIYYDAVIACVRGAEAILILGPGEAKAELKKRLEIEGLGNRVVGIKTVDKMTDRQIVARVRKRFLE